LEDIAASVFIIREDNLFDYIEDGDKKLLRNMGNKLPVNTALCRKEFLSASTNLCKLQIIQIYSCWSNIRLAVINKTFNLDPNDRETDILFIY
jgi:hypothetical protein